ncbi:MAG: FMN-binding protein [Acholeplasmataceae bacterium]
MKDYIKLLVFISIVALITSFAFISMDLLFSARIEQNQNAAFYEAVLVHNEIEFTDENLFDVFDENITTQTYTYNGKEVVIYSNNTTNTVSFVFGLFQESGAWGAIIGVMTVNEAFDELINVSVLQNEEQAGKDVNKRYFLDQFKNLDMTTVLDTTALYDEIDQLTGATVTSNGIQAILIESYNIYKDLWESEA